ncbi:MAG: DUF2334 domain-containing protein [Balneolaceae bacterium]|nr:DUF2334 domain-containing protein [Balneolaceae bacterium]
MFKKTALLLIIAFCQVSLTFAQTESLKFIIRVDDILNRNTTILPRSIVPFQDSVESRGGKVTWGVIPHRLIETANVDGVLAEELKATITRGHEVSVHGFDHICNRCESTPRAAFWGHEMYCTTHNEAFTKAEQTALIQDGLALFAEHLDFVPTSFIPPGHVTDATTFEVLSDFNLTSFSDDTEAQFMTNNVFNFPINEEYTWALSQEMYQQNLDSALADIKMAASETGIYGLMLHDHFTRSGYSNGIVLDWMVELMDSLNHYYGDNIEYLTLSEAVESIKGQFVSVEEASEEIADFQLHQNYPNPFNPATTISFTLEKASRVKLLVFDIQGRVVSALINQSFSAGNHQIPFNAGNLPSGQYFYSLTAGGQTTTKSMTLIK